MNITVLGATGMAGAAITQEAARRGHQVIAASRHPQPTAERHVTPTPIDLTHADGTLLQLVRGADAVVVALRKQPGDETELASLTIKVLDCAKTTRTNVLVVGGAAPLRSPRNPQVLVLDDSTYVPSQWRDVAVASFDQFAACLAHPHQNWTYLSPSAVFEPGQGSGAYRRGTSTLLTNPDGTSHITPADLALAVLDELENPSGEHHFTVIEKPNRTLSSSKPPIRTSTPQRELNEASPATFQRRPQPRNP